MKNKSIKIFLSLLACFGLVALYATPTYAADDACDPSVPEAIRSASGCSNAPAPSASIQDIITNILYGIIAVLGLVAVVFIVKGGIDYMTSAGDAQKLQKAKSTILYAAIGLVISVLAFAIVNFTIGIISGKNATTDGNGGTNTSENGTENSPKQPAT